MSKTATDKKITNMKAILKNIKDEYGSCFKHHEKDAFKTVRYRHRQLKNFLTAMDWLFHGLSSQYDYNIDLELRSERYFWKTLHIVGALPSTKVIDLANRAIAIQQKRTFFCEEDHHVTHAQLAELNRILNELRDIATKSAFDMINFDLCQFAYEMDDLADAEIAHTRNLVLGEFNELNDDDLPF